MIVNDLRRQLAESKRGKRSLENRIAAMEGDWEKLNQVASSLSSMKHRSGERPDPPQVTEGREPIEESKLERVFPVI